MISASNRVQFDYMGGSGVGGIFEVSGTVKFGCSSEIDNTGLQDDVRDTHASEKVPSFGLAANTSDLKVATPRYAAAVVMLYGLYSVLILCLCYDTHDHTSHLEWSCFKTYSNTTQKVDRHF